MRKLLKLLEWVSVPDAAKYLSTIVGESVSEANLLRLALDDQIVLSVVLVNGAFARRAQISRPDKAPRGECAVRSMPELAIEFDKDVVSISGLWDLSMLGCEWLNVESKYQQLTNGPTVHVMNSDGLLLCRDKTFYQLQVHHDRDRQNTKHIKSPYTHPDNFSAVLRFPEDAVLVVRTDELARFQADLASADKITPVTVSRMDPRADATYLNIIGGLLTLMLGKTPAGKPQSVFESQAAIIEALNGHHPNTQGLSKATLEVKFAEARRRLNSS